MIRKTFTIMLLLSMLIANCTKQDLGFGSGALTGALVGSTLGKGSGKIAAIALGSVFGAFLGNSIGKSLDDKDRMHYKQSSQHAFENLPTGKSNSWSNPDSGNSGTTMIRKTYQKHNGQYCREFQQTITVAGKTQQGYGVACRQPDGNWQITNG